MNNSDKKELGCRGYSKGLSSSHRSCDRNTVTPSDHRTVLHTDHVLGTYCPVIPTLPLAYVTTASSCPSSHTPSHSQVRTSTPSSLTSGVLLQRLLPICKAKSRWDNYSSCSSPLKPRAKMCLQDLQDAGLRVSASMVPQQDTAHTVAGAHSTVPVMWSCFRFSLMTPLLFFLVY